MVRSLVCSLVALAVGLPISAAGVQGLVQIKEKDGRLRASLADCVAMLEPIEASFPPAGPMKPMAIRTVGKQFLPRVAIVTPGTEVAFPNLDHILHNVFSVTQGNRFDTGAYRPGDAPKVRVTNTGLVKLYCNVHHQMNAFLWVVTTPFAQVLDGKTGLQFDQVPAGTYRLRLWHPEAGEKVWIVTVGLGITQGTWELEISFPRIVPHKNKFGRDYAPPSDERNY